MHNLNFCDFPEELIFNVTSFLDRPDLVRLAGANKQLQRISRDDAIWRPLARLTGLPFQTNIKAAWGNKIRQKMTDWKMENWKEIEKCAQQASAYLTITNEELEAKVENNFKHMACNRRTIWSMYSMIHEHSSALSRPLEEGIKAHLLLSYIGKSHLNHAQEIAKRITHLPRFESSDNGLILFINECIQLELPEQALAAVSELKDPLARNKMRQEIAFFYIGKKKIERAIAIAKIIETDERAKSYIFYRAAFFYIEQNELEKAIEIGKLIDSKMGGFERGELYVRLTVKGCETEKIAFLFSE
ncbi:F-box-like domain-containing protein [Candidatus Protochlamydia phocaeensis]|uniref:F-box-like domain-containing protein n=1 Tax=Candidatus Protochlamydia phocaeensis TaxID=1414722 RepID=UPI000838957E|nr:F-box-like domain-containing protein [Candidatus Protochlamydia phocaeensis]